MAKPTHTQMDTVTDLEAALIILQEQPGVKITIGKLLEHANISIATLYGVVSRLQIGRHYDLIDRMRAVFSHANKVPVCLSIDVVERPNAADQGVSLPCGPPEALDVYPGPEVRPKLRLVNDSQDALSEILNIMKPFSKTERDRIISATSMFYGIGM